jgi:hypothetical protein
MCQSGLRPIALALLAHCHRHGNWVRASHSSDQGLVCSTMGHVNVWFCRALVVPDATLVTVSAKISRLYSKRLQALLNVLGLNWNLAWLSWHANSKTAANLFCDCAQIFGKLVLVFVLVFHDWLSRLYSLGEVATSVAFNNACLPSSLCERSCRPTERRFHRSRRPGIYLTNVLYLLVKRIHLRTHEFGLNFNDVFHILGLAEFLYEPKSSANVFGRITQKLLI